MSFGEIKQIAYLTNDIEATMQQWLQKQSLGPFTWYRNLTMPMCHKGENVEVAMEVAIAYRGNMQIELIQQTNNAPSPYRAFYERQQMGLHHLAYATQDIDVSLQAVRGKGLEVLTTIDAAIGRYAYFRDPAMPENIFEFLQLTPDLHGYWEQCAEEAKGWDGSNPIRIIDMN